MAINLMKCYRVFCDGCGCEIDEGADCIPYFGSYSKAKKYVADHKKNVGGEEGWAVVDGIVICGECREAKKLALIKARREEFKEYRDKLRGLVAEMKAASIDDDEDAVLDVAEKIRNLKTEIDRDKEEKPGKE